MERNKNNNLQATIYPLEVLEAWNEKLLTINYNVPSNVPYRENSYVHPNPEPQFVGTEEIEEQNPSFGR